MSNDFSRQSSYLQVGHYHVKPFASASKGASGCDRQSLIHRQTTDFGTNSESDGVINSSQNTFSVDTSAIETASLETAPSDTTQRIVTSITQAIVQRRLVPGTKLAEQKLADIYGVSRTLVRQALNQLSRDHLVTLTPARGAHVATPSIEEAHQVFEVRNLLETALIGQLCERINAEQINTLKAHLLLEQSAIERHDIAERTRLLGEFHVLLAKLHGNTVLTELLIDLLNRSSLIALMYQSSPSAERSHQEHVQLVKALEKQNTASVQQLMSQHLHNVERHLKFNPMPQDLADALKSFV